MLAVSQWLMFSSALLPIDPPPSSAYADSTRLDGKVVVYRSTCLLAHLAPAVHGRQCADLAQAGVHLGDA
ncbi:hypothetical protein FA95DRAFT_1553927 [Auriscalpium vulgare]|uniref:Uncharacterized protein n=1 Tax=Auriscalpium vulgare TaxID=40419 RepID=A0ACB8S7K8_9AGAM|nr:hypothetical protein FA95DRAFT_1553927 [Auriscalpium vulgare]